MPIHDWTRVDAGIFHHFHGSWITEVCRVLNAGLLPPDYYALTEQVAGPGNPDVLALRVPGNGAADRSPSADAGPSGGIALKTAAPSARFHDRAENEVYAGKARSAVVRRTNGDRVVSVIEIVSPGNKASQHAIRSFVTKAVEYLDAGVHLLEPVAVGDVLPEIPLFLAPGGHIPVLLEPTYQAAWTEVPRRWQQVLEPAAGS